MGDKEDTALMAFNRFWGCFCIVLGLFRCRFGVGRPVAESTPDVKLGVSTNGWVRNEKHQEHQEGKTSESARV